MVIVVQPGFTIVVLAGKPQIVFNGADCNIRLAERQVIRRPDDGAGGVGEALGGAQVVVVVIVDGVF
jgi:hypothetical protein